VAAVAQADLLLLVGIGYETFVETLLQSAGAVPQVVVSTGIAVLPFAGHDHEAGDQHAGEEDHAEDKHSLEPLGLYGDEGVCEDHHADEAAAEAEHSADEEHSHDHGECDPHVWTNPANVAIWADNIAEAFAAADPSGADIYRANAAAYTAQLEALDAEIEALLAAVPAEQRILLTNHEFLGYFAQRYGFEVIGGILGATTLAEPDPQTIAALLDEVRERQVRAIFAEVSAGSRFSDLIAAEAGIGVVTSLYSESLSAPDGPAATYLDYLRFNAAAIAAALTGG
jgi:ABC-type Zn uptake system ZnuABC Zn-binding protein ZnuA